MIVDSTVRAGGSHTLECGVSVIPNLVVQPSVQWVGPGNSMLASGTGISLNATLTRVNTSDAGQYTCVAAVVVDSVELNVEGRDIATLSVQSESSNKRA